MLNGDLHEKRPVQGCEDNIRLVSVEALLGSDISQFDLHRIEQTMSLLRYRGKLNATAVKEQVSGKSVKGGHLTCRSATCCSVCRVRPVGKMRCHVFGAGNKGQITLGASTAATAAVRSLRDMQKLAT